MDLQTWLQRADIWRFVARAEAISEVAEVVVVPSNTVEAWVCGQNRFCLSTRLTALFTPAQQQAVIAHEIGHLIIPRDYGAHPQLWEVQADLLAATILRDPTLVREMLLALEKACRGCSDHEHPAPLRRVALLDEYADELQPKVAAFDRLRHGFIVECKVSQPALAHLRFAITNALANGPIHAPTKEITKWMMEARTSAVKRWQALDHWPFPAAPLLTAPLSLPARGNSKR